jgi:short-subunit dehydrogenase
MAVYCATKAYVLSFSEAVNNEVSDKGVSVTALCPGATNTHFKSAAGMESSKLFKNKNLPTGQEVAKYGYAAMMKGKPVAIHGTLNFILANSARFIPRSWVVKVARMVIE